MGIVILFVVIGITYFVYCQDAYRDSEKTVRSKEIAMNNGKLVYDKYGSGGKVKSQRLVSTNEKVKVDIFGNVTNSRGQKLFNFKDVYRDNLRERSKELSKARGYKGFYVHVLPPSESTGSGWSDYISSTCVQESTGRLFEWVRDTKACGLNTSKPPYIYKAYFKTNGLSEYTGIRIECDVELVRHIRETCIMVRNSVSNPASQSFL